MSTLALSAATPAQARFRHLIAAEWLKLRSLRSTPWGLAISAVAIVAVNLNASLADYSQITAQSSAAHGDFSTALFDSFTDIASQVLMLTTGSIGAIMIVSEFSSGLVLTTFAAVPHRRAVMAAKVTALSAVMTLYGLLIALVSFATVQTVLAGRHAAAPMTDPHSIRTIAASTLLAPVCALVGLCVGSIVRHSASSIVTTVVVLLLLPVVFAGTNPWSAAISRLLPHSAWYHLSAEQFAGPMNGRVPSTPGAWTVYAVWAILAATITVLIVDRRDV